MGIFKKNIQYSSYSEKKALNEYFTQQVSLFSCRYVRKNIMVRGETITHPYTSYLHSFMCGTISFAFLKNVLATSLHLMNVNGGLGVIHHKPP